MAMSRGLSRNLDQPDLSRPLSQPGGGGGGAPVVDPLLAAVLAEFGSGEVGAVYDNKDLSSFFSDSAATTPATVNGVVGCLLDKSPNGFHLRQTTTASKPILRQSGDLYYLEFDGVDDFMVTDVQDWTGTNEATVCFGARKTSDAAIGSLAALGDAATQNGAWDIRLPGSGGSASANAVSRGTAAVGAFYSNAIIAAPVTRVLTAVMKISTDTAILRVNAVQRASAVADQGTGNYGNYPVYTGRRAGNNPFVGHGFGGAYIGRNSFQITAAFEAFTADRTGVTL